VVTSKFFSTLKELSTEEKADIVKGAFVDDPGRYGSSKDHRIMYIDHIIAIHRLLHTDRLDHFPSRGTPDEGPTYFGFAAEDWNRGFAFFKNYYKKLKPAKGGATSRATATKFNVAIIPRYLTDHDLATMEDSGGDSGDEGEDDEAKAARHQRKKWLAQRDRLEEMLRDDHDDPYDPQDPINKATLESHTQALEGQLISTVSSKAQAGSKGLAERPKVPKEEVIRFCENQARDVQVLWGPEQIDQMRLECAEDLHDAGQLDVGHVVDSLGHLAVAQRRDEGDEDGEGPRAAVEDELSDEDKLGKLDLRLKQSIASHGAPIPGFLESCAYAGLDPEDLQVKGADEGLNDGKPLYFKIHQPPGTFSGPCERAPASLVSSSQQGPLLGLLSPWGVFVTRAM
jgi:hypothetical protein